MLGAMIVCAFVGGQNLLANEVSSFTFCYESTELYPHFVGNSDQTPEYLPGVSVDMVKLIASRAKLKPVFVRHPWKRCLALLSAGRVDGVIASFSAERDKIGVYPRKDQALDPSRRISTAGYYLYQIADEAPVWDGENFLIPDLAVGAPLGYSVVAELRDRQVGIVEAGSTEDLLKLLIWGRVQAIAAPGLATDNLIKKGGKAYGSARKISAPLKVKDYYMLLSRQFYDRSPELAEQVWNITATVRETASDIIALQY